MRHEIDDHISFSVLVKFVRGEATMDTGMERHLEGCPDCRRKLSWMKTIRVLREKDSAKSDRTKAS